MFVCDYLLMCVILHANIVNINTNIKANINTNLAMLLYVTISTLVSIIYFFWYKARYTMRQTYVILTSQGAQN